MPCVSALLHPVDALDRLDPYGACLEVCFLMTLSIDPTWVGLGMQGLR